MDDATVPLLLEMYYLSRSQEVGIGWSHGQVVTAAIRFGYSASIKRINIFDFAGFLHFCNRIRGWRKLHLQRFLAVFLKMFVLAFVAFGKKPQEGYTLSAGSCSFFL